MDPWSCQTHVTDFDKKITKFEDDFIPLINNDKLPDHEAYLAILESKLRKIKSDPNVLRQLAAKKEGFMLQLLNEEHSYSVEQSHLDEPIPNSQILRTLLPQKQALNQGEVVELIKYDQLSSEADDIDNTEPVSEYK
ncbi:uncharacterized protein LOC143202058 isoform X2 [Rhynchophorus ferrugineus]|uniref:uncharacterized protein LOC143202058 isoform X2 n=1 Tax=Rhynchophorus ferrugineus TaxID=354439 RepID=UPI003FCD7730